MSLARTPLATLAAVAPGSPVRVAGRIVAQTDDAALLRDDSGSATLVDARERNEADARERSIVGTPTALNALVFARGTWNGRAVAVDALEVVGTAAVEPGELLELSQRGDQKQRRLFARAQILREVRAFFERRGFLEVETPLVVPSPGLDVHLSALPVATRAGERFLITSPEYQMKRLLAGGLERIYQITKCFRGDEAGERHQPEFTMLEWYRAFSDAEAVMRDTEQLVAEVAIARGGEPVLATAMGPVDVRPPWPRLTVREAFARYAGVALETVADDEERFARLLIERVEPALSTLGALFLCEYPATMASLARKKPSDPSVAERFEAYVGGLELCNGFGELTDPVEQRTRLLADQAARARLGLPVYPIDERFLAALEQGMPPSGGNALGLDRLVMLALGAHHIEEVIALPASRL